MAHKNIQMKKREGSQWDNLYPITLDSNVFDTKGVPLSQKLANTVNSLNAKIDEKHQEVITQLDQKSKEIGDLDNLITSSKSSVVEAINEVKENIIWVNAKDHGISPDKADNFAALQALINNNKGKTIQLDYGVYRISKPIRLPLNTRLRGVTGLWNDGNGTVLKRTTNTPDSKHGVDAILILDYEEGESYHRNSHVQNINLDGYDDKSRNEYGIYAPKTAYINLENVHVRYVDTVFYTEDTWQSVFNISGRYATNGIVFASPNQMGTGTSNIFHKCFMSYMDGKAYHIYGLTYSTFNSCAADFIDDEVYHFNRCRGIVLNSPGSEYSRDVFTNWASTVTVNGMRIYSPRGKTGTQGSGYLKTRAGGKTTFNSCDFDVLTEPGNTFNIICDQGGEMVFINTPLPTGGNNYISYSGGASITEIKGNEIITRNANGTFKHVMQKDVGITSLQGAKNNVKGKTPIFQVKNTGIYQNSGVEMTIFIRDGEATNGAGTIVQKVLFSFARSGDINKSNVFVIGTSKSETYGSLTDPEYSIDFNAANDVFTVSITPKSGTVSFNYYILASNTNYQNPEITIV